MSSQAKLMPQASFVFKGTVQKLKSTTMRGLSATSKTCVVRVDEILSAPPLLADYAGSEITVILGSRETIKEGEQAAFYTNSCLVGESLAVRSVGHTTTATVGALKATGTNDPGLGLIRLQQRVENADAVVTGKVTAVRVLDQQSSRGARQKTSTDILLSEHNPLWQEAVIDVAGVEKGSRKPKQLFVRFPDSSDVSWYGAPKLRLGQERVFLLNKEAAPEVAGSASRPTASKKKSAANTYTVVDSDAIQPLRNVGTIRRFIKSKSSKR